MFKNDFLYRIDTVWICLVFFTSIILWAYLGKMAGSRFYFRKIAESEIDFKSLKSIEGGLFGLFGLMMGFTFNLTATRYQTTKQILIDEANTIGSAIIMSELYHPKDEAAYKKDFKLYLETAIAYYDAGIDKDKINQERLIIKKVTDSLWARTSRLSYEKDYHMASRNMIPALKEMINSGYNRQAATRSRMPDMILIMLYVVSISCAFLAGFTTQHIRAKEKYFITTFAIISTLVLFIILDFDRPLRGLITDRIGEETMKEKFYLLKMK